MSLHTVLWIGRHSCLNTPVSLNIFHSTIWKRPRFTQRQNTACTGSHNWEVTPVYQNERSGLDQAASTAHTVHSAIKTGQDISSTAKGAAVGGPYGAAAGLALTASKHGKGLLAGCSHY